MTIDILTTFPQMFEGPLTESILKRAKDNGIVTINIHNLRNWATDTRHTTDDRPYGGGPGMVMLIEPIDRAIKQLMTQDSGISTKIILTSASGKTFNQPKAVEYSKLDHLIIIAGHYEGVDYRVEETLVDESISIGDFVLTGGELPAMIITDAVTRLLPGALGDDQSIIDESHSAAGYLEYPHYTRPEDYQGRVVPKVLLSGNHAEIIKWRQQNSRKK